MVLLNDTVANCECTDGSWHPPDTCLKVLISTVFVQVHQQIASCLTQQDIYMYLRSFMCHATSLNAHLKSNTPHYNNHCVVRCTALPLAHVNNSSPPVGCLLRRVQLALDALGPGLAIRAQGTCLLLPPRLGAHSCSRSCCHCHHVRVTEQWHGKLARLQVIQSMVAPKRSLMSFCHYANRACQGAAQPQNSKWR